ncbi:MAG: TlpA family protein disulfide reductase [Sphingobacteriaceae bacterium]|nr:TlpA family protein disulfide reductase [Sphingobacteriaceae bacterium]
MNRFACIILLFLSFSAYSQISTQYKSKYFDQTSFFGDTLPQRVMTAIRQFEQAEANRLEKFIKENQPSDAKVKELMTNQQYLAAYNFYRFLGGNKFKIRAAYKRNFKEWQRIQDSLFSVVKLDNEEAFSSPVYKDLIATFLLREKERLWEESGSNPREFFKRWYNASVEEGAALFQADMSNILKEKIITHYFSGKTAEYMYSLLFKDIVEDSDPTNALVIFQRFKQKYPQSPYLATITPQMAKIEANLQRSLSSKMVFFTDNGTKLNTFKEMLDQVKGKTVLVDMWGTWCGPCREEIEKNGPALKKHFAGKGLDYLYVACYDSKNEKKWKDLIAYFNLEGMHLLANQALNDDIMKSVKSSGYPTYFIIKKDGSFEKSKAGYPMKRDVLIKQLEEALAQ